MRTELFPDALPDPLLARVERAAVWLSDHANVREGRLSWWVDLDGHELAVRPRFRELGRDDPDALDDVLDDEVCLDDLASLARRLVDPTPQDERIAALVASLSSREDFYDRPVLGLGPLVLLDFLVGHPRVRVRGRDGVVRVERARPSIALVAEDGDRGRLALALGGELVPRSRVHVTSEGLAWDRAEEGRLVVALLPHETRELVESVLDVSGTLLPREALARFLDRLTERPLGIAIDLPPELRGRDVVADGHVAVVVAPERHGASVSLRVRPIPKGPLLPPGEGSVRLRATVAGERLATARDFDAEQAHARAVAQALELDGLGIERNGWRLPLESDDDVLDLVAAFEERLGARPDVSLEWPVATARRRVVKPPSSALRVDVANRQDWFSLEGGLAVDGELVAIGKILAAAREGRRYVALADGRFAAIAHLLEGKVADVALVTHEREGTVALARAAAPLVAPALPRTPREPAAWTTLVERARELARAEHDPSPSLRAELRSYQLEGYRWLRRHELLGTGACLADDMGLGKTVQSIAVLVDRADRGPALVVAPTSVGPNWLREIARFAPGLSARAYRGSQRGTLLRRVGPGDVVIASYGLLRRDREMLSTVGWGTLVLDEAQAIKNGASQTANAARAIPREWTLALTGTPVENHLGELWSLFQVIAPGLLGTWSDFAARFARPIEVDRDADRRAALARIVRPFLLRRTKGSVLAELPPRSEVRLDVELSRVERALYEKARQDAIAALAHVEPGREGRFYVLAALLRLRQLACHPRLVDPEGPESSAKLAALLERLEQVVAGGHHALVFSQFTRHLDLVGDALDARGIEWIRLDGSTAIAERQTLVDRFQSGEVPVFLISLRAGGTGLNLTSADYVFLLDPWWNPAVEDQATDRAHRMGQTRPVTVVRLVARDTIEERVLALHADKRDLIAGVLEGADGGVRLSTEDLIALLRDAGAGPTADDADGDDPAPDESLPEDWPAWLDRFKGACSGLQAPTRDAYAKALEKVLAPLRSGGRSVREGLVAFIEDDTRAPFATTERLALRRFVAMLESDRVLPPKLAQRVRARLGTPRRGGAGA